MTARRSQTGPWVARAAAAMAAILGLGAAATADPIRIDAQFVGEDGQPLQAFDVRLVVGSDPGARDPEAGVRLATDADGHISHAADADVAMRSITLDNAFFRHPARTIEIGVEMELVGRRALYRITLDLVRDGTVGAMTAFVQGPDGRFDRQLEFDSGSHAFSFPDQPGGMLMTSIGADLKFHEMTGADGGPWIVDLVVEKQVFTVR